MFPVNMVTHSLDKACDITLFFGEKRQMPRCAHWIACLSEGGL